MSFDSATGSRRRSMRLCTNSGRLNKSSMQRRADSFVGFFFPSPCTKPHAASESVSQSAILPSLSLSSHRARGEAVFAFRFIPFSFPFISSLGPHTALAFFCDPGASPGQVCQAAYIGQGDVMRKSPPSQQLNVRRAGPTHHTAIHCRINLIFFLWTWS